MRFSIATAALVSALFAHAAPLSRRQGAGFGAACDSILADEDTMEGETVRGAGVTVAKAIPRGLYARQGAGFGAACDSILADEDTMEGETVRGTGVTIANAIPQNGVPAAKVKRQLNGISDGVTAPLKAVSATKNFGEQTDEYGNTVDNELTQDSANEGAAVGELELETGTFLGGSNGASGGSSTAPPPPPHKRQLNGISDGIAAPLKAIAPTKQFGEGFDEWGNQVDGTLTDDSAATGEDVGNIELTTGSYLGGSNGRSGGSR